MFKERPLRWIGEAEARQMLIHALSEASAPAADTDRDACELTPTWVMRVRRWMFPVRSAEAGC